MWAGEEESRVQLGPNQLRKLQDRNKLLDILENQGQQIVVVGDTSSGKSTTINFLLGYPFNFVAPGIGTRRPCVMTMIPDPSRREVLFRVKFAKNDHLEEKEYTSLTDVAAFVKAVNDAKSHPEWFDCLNPGSNMRSASGEPLRPDDAFDETPVFVQLMHKDIECPMRLVDVPGLTRGNWLTTKIAQSYIKPDNAVILVIGKDHPNNGGFPALAAAMKQCSKTLVIQNFASTKIQDNQVTENWNVISDKMSGAEDLVLYCIDYGLTYDPNLPLWKEGSDQQDWHGINEKDGIQAVRKAMVKHTEMKGKDLEEKYSSSQVFSRNIVAGLGPVRKKLNEFQFHDIDGHIQRLRQDLEQQIMQKRAELLKAESRVKQLQFPPEWDSMLASFANTIRKYLDSTHAPTEMLELLVGQTEEDRVLWNTQDEVRKSKLEEGDERVASKGPRIPPTPRTRGPGQQPCGGLQIAQETRFPHQISIASNDGDILYWFNDDVDKRIVGLLTQYCGFESGMRLACVRSWQRLIDEFTGMLAFAPMPCVPLHQHSMAKMRIGSGQSGQLNFTEETVKLVVGLKQHRGGAVVRPLLETFDRRIRTLVDRDYRNAVGTIERRCNAELERFFRLVAQEDWDDGRPLIPLPHANSPTRGRQTSHQELSAEARRKEDIKIRLMEGVLRALLDHKDKVITSVLIGEYERDENGVPISDPVTKRERLKERSGIMVRIGENTTTPGPLHWMLPFKFNNSGQMALRGLSLGEDKAKAVMGKQSSCLAKRVGALMNCCDRQREEVEFLTLPGGALGAGLGDPEEPWKQQLLDEIDLQLEDGNPTINCCNAVNLRIYRLCTEEYEGPNYALARKLAGPLAFTCLYDVEVLKLLKALQFELAASWSAMWRGMLQELVDREKIRQFIQRSVSKEPELAYIASPDLMPQQPQGRQQVARDPVIEAAEAIVNYFGGAETGAELLTTEDEIKAAGDDAKWPDHAAYMEVLTEIGKRRESSHQTFLHSRLEKLAGQPSWLRLCDEFVFVILQLQMRRITVEELSMVKASAGAVSVAGQQEVITKLVLHRMSQLNMHSEAVFAKRLDFLYKRDIQAALKHMPEVLNSLLDTKRGGKDAVDWLTGQLIQYKDLVLSQALAGLKEKFEGLQPFDFAILNGRFPLSASKLRKLHFALLDDGKTVKQTDASKDIAAMWSQPRYPKRFEVEVTAAEGKNPGVMMLSCDGTLSAYSNLQEQTERVEQIFKLPPTDPPGKDCAGGAFQELCLKFYKAIHVDAIHYCRPRLKAMMAQLYKEEDLRRALQESPALDYLKDFGGHILDKQKQKVESLKCRLREMEEALKSTE